MPRHATGRSSCRPQSFPVPAVRRDAGTHCPSQKWSHRSLATHKSCSPNGNLAGLARWRQVGLPTNPYKLCHSLFPYETDCHPEHSERSERSRRICFCFARSENPRPFMLRSSSECTMSSPRIHLQAKKSASGVPTVPEKLTTLSSAATAPPSSVVSAERRSNPPTNSPSDNYFYQLLAD